ncbi:hypothetical protein HCW_01455 [Helicobacter cetorum MIT 00-7128]|uniref:Uncharacterized protein n=1 Tax=Helicobacter cetorum (strain ATCC BAA-429 / MIT 00-7128) TaxID=182217 RepID=I0EKV7_HELC0|nr:hypothetical protein [Helicobacter cetorum]AFI03576.1 hypothetical protein HCW_01455 [Helicobacter cetorum MIT 00-7128]
MPNNASKLEIIKQSFNSLTKTDKIAFLKAIENKETSTIKTPIQKGIKECLHCEFAKLVRNDANHNKQRFLCNSYKKNRATKDLDKCLTYYHFVNFIKASYKEMILFKHIQNSEYINKGLEISKKISSNSISDFL